MMPGDKVAYAKAVIAGQTVPEPLPTTAEVEGEFDRDLPRLTSGQRRVVVQDANIQRLYGGRPVACYTLGDGFKVPLEVGEDAIDALYAGLTDAEARQIAVHFPDAWAATPPALARIMQEVG